MEKVKVYVTNESDGSVLLSVDDSVCDRYKCGLYGTGKDLFAAKEDLQQVCDLMREEIPDMPEFEFSYHYTVQSFLVTFSPFLTLAGLERATGIHQKQLWQYKSGRHKPTDKTVEKVFANVSRFGEELANLSIG